MTTACAAGLLDRVRLLGPDITAAQEDAERRCALPDRLVVQLQEAGVFRMTMPRVLGGLESDPLVQLDVIEELARHDASTAWVAMIGSDSGYYSAFLAPEVTAEVYADVDAVTAGFISPAGLGRRAPGGYCLSGRWPFGSAAPHASWFASGFSVEHAQGSDAGCGEWRIALLPAADVQVLGTWDTLGLRGTGSSDYTARDVVVATERTFSFSDAPHHDGALYRFPGMFLTNMAAVPLGTAQGALASLVELAGRKRRPGGSLLRDDVRVQNAVAAAEAQVGSARCYLHDAVGRLWDALVVGDEPTREHRARVWLATAHAFSASRVAVERVVDAAATSAIYATSPLQRALRDVVTMNQHVMAQPRIVDACGRLLLGRDADVPLL